MAQYGSIDYWDERYQNDTEPFEWFQNYASVRRFLTPKYLCRPGETNDNGGANIAESDGKGEGQGLNSVSEATTKNPFHSTKECRVLIAGCGNSRVGESMLSDGFAPSNITSVDFSSIVIKQMKEKYTSEWHEQLLFRLRQERKLGDEGSMKSPAKKSQTRSRPFGATKRPKKKPDASPVEKMSFECMDLTKKLSFSNESFDLIFCKGTLDAVLCCANTLERIQRMMGEVHRVLDSRHGVMVIISYGEPEHRLNLFDPSLWDVKHYSIPKPNVPGEKMGEDHYVYILFKKER